MTRIYRAALDYLGTLPPEAWEKVEEIQLPPVFLEEIVKTGTRGISENFISHRPGSSEMLYTSSRAAQEVEPVAVVREEGASPLVEIRNVLEPGDRIEYMLPGIDILALTVDRMETEGGEETIRANPGNRVRLHTTPSLLQGRVNGILRRNKNRGV